MLEEKSPFDEDDNDFEDVFKSGTVDTKKYKGLPVDPPLASLMAVDIVINEKGKVWIMHEYPLARRLMWIEYDMDLNKLTLITKDGIVQDIGMPIKPLVSKYLRKVTSVSVLATKVEDKKSNFYIVALATRRAGLLYVGNKQIIEK